MLLKKNVWQNLTADSQGNPIVTGGAYQFQNDVKGSLIYIYIGSATPTNPPSAEQATGSVAGGKTIAFPVESGYSIWAAEVLVATSSLFFYPNPDTTGVVYKVNDIEPNSSGDVTLTAANIDTTTALPNSGTPANSPVQTALENLDTLAGNANTAALAAQATANTAITTANTAESTATSASSTAVAAETAAASASSAAAAAQATANATSSSLAALKDNNVGLSANYQVGAAVISSSSNQANLNAALSQLSTTNSSSIAANTANIAINSSSIAALSTSLSGLSSSLAALNDTGVALSQNYSIAGAIVSSSSKQAQYNSTAAAQITSNTNQISAVQSAITSTSTTFTKVTANTGIAVGTPTTQTTVPFAEYTSTTGFVSSQNLPIGGPFTAAQTGVRCYQVQSGANGKIINFNALLNVIYGSVNGIGNYTVWSYNAAATPQYVQLGGTLTQQSAVANELIVAQIPAPASVNNSGTRGTTASNITVWTGDYIFVAGYNTGTGTATVQASTTFNFSVPLSISPTVIGAASLTGSNAFSGANNFAVSPTVPTATLGNSTSIAASTQFVAETVQQAVSQISAIYTTSPTLNGTITFNIPSSPNYQTVTINGSGGFGTLGSSTSQSFSLSVTGFSTNSFNLQYVNLSGNGRIGFANGSALILPNTSASLTFNITGWQQGSYAASPVINVFVYNGNLL